MKLRVNIISRTRGDNNGVTFDPPPDKLLALLADYSKRADDLDRTDFLKHYKKLNVTLHTAVGKEPWVTGDIPSDQTLWMTFHKLRPFQLKNETTYFPKICNSLSRHFSHPSLSLLFKHWKQRFLGEWFSKSFPIVAVDNILNSESYFDKYVNSTEYHFDPDKGKTVKEAAQFLPLESQKALIVVLLHGKLSAITTVKSFIKLINKGMSGTTITVSGP